MTRYYKTKHYSRVHTWIKREKGQAMSCQINQKHIGRRFEWANISREYLYKYEDWVQLCHRCHMIFDRNQFTLEKLIERCGFKKYVRTKKVIRTNEKRHPLAYYFPELLL